MTNKKDIESIPVIIWYSDPVQPDETVVLSGDIFSKESMVEFYRLEDGNLNPPSKNIEFDTSSANWKAVAPLQWSSQSLKAVIPPEWEHGIFACRVKDGKRISNTVFINSPDPWWFQADEGLETARPGGWLQIMGKSLDFDGKSIVVLHAQDGNIIRLHPEKATCYSLSVHLPDNIGKGEYTVWTHNGYGGNTGYRNACILNILGPKPKDRYIINVLDYGADPLGKKDCTLPIVTCMARLVSLGGGVAYFPRGRYRIDSKHRANMWIETPLKLNAGITLRGESADLTSLWWPDHKDPLPSLIEGGNDFAVEDLTIYTQGRHRNIITGENNVRISRVCIRVNCFYMCGYNGAAHHDRGIDEVPDKTGAAIDLCGANNQVVDCDIYHPGIGFRLKNSRGTVIRRNKIYAASMVAISNGADGLIFENNEFRPNSLTAGGNGIDVYCGSARHIYYAYNYVSHIYGGDHENLTLDGHGTAYFGRLAEVNGLKITLQKDPIFGRGERDTMPTMHDTTIYIIFGKGTGQYRQVTCYDGRKIETDRPWDVAPDKDSIVSIGVFNGRHLIIGNTGQDTGTLVQLYPPNCECIVAENRGIRASNINSLSRLGRNERSPFNRVEPSWYNQFFDNHILVGNGWGGGGTEIDRWIGGETCLNIWGWHLRFAEYPDYKTKDRLLSENDLISMLGDNPRPGKAIPLSLFQIVRRHRIDNNSYIRIRGAVSDVLVEKSVIRDSYKGISVESAINWEYGPDTIGPLDFEPEPNETNLYTYLSPELVLLRKNEFHGVDKSCCGNVLESEIRDENNIKVLDK